MFEKEAFSAHVGSDFILVSLDFPDGEEAKAKVPNPERNEELKLQFGVDNFPTVLLMTPQGEVFGKTGYTGASPEEYLKNVRMLSVKGKMSLEKVKAILTSYAEAEDKLVITKHAIELLMEMKDAVAAKPLAEIVRKSFQLDPENLRGLRIDALMALLQSSNADKAELEMAAVEDAKNKFGLLEYVVAGAMNQLRTKEDLSGFLIEAEALHQTGMVHNAELVSFLWVNSAYFCHKYLDRPEQAVVWAKRAQEVGSLDEDAEEVLQDILSEEDPA